MKYSVLMSVYEKEKPEWLRTSIKSMLNQTVPPSEIVLVKDGRLTQELEAVIKQFVSGFPGQFHIVPLEENVGLGPALAIGIQHCKFEYIARMDSDDVSLETRCEKLLKCFEDNSNLEVVGSYEVEFENCMEEIVAVHKVPEGDAEIKKAMKRRCSLLHPTVMYKKETVLKAGNYRDVRLYEDYDLFIRMVLENNACSYNIQEGLYYMRINSDFYKRRGGFSYLKTVVCFKFHQYRKQNMSFKDFMVSAGGQALVCLLPNSMRKKFYIRYLR